MNLPFTYKNPIILDELKIVNIKIHHVYFNDFNIFFKSLYHRKVYFLQLFFEYYF